MKFIALFIYYIFLLSCSDMPNEVPLDSSRDIDFSVNMQKAIDSNQFNVDSDSIFLIIDTFNTFRMLDDDGDAVYSVTVEDLFVGSIYSYQYAINENVEDTESGRNITVYDDENIVFDLYGELNPTILTFLIDMSYQEQLDNFNSSENSIYIVGSLNNWKGQQMELSVESEYIYEITILDIEVGQEIIYKFRIDETGWEVPNPSDSSSCSDDGYGGCNRLHIVEQGIHRLSHQFSDENGD